MMSRELGNDEGGEEFRGAIDEKQAKAEIAAGLRALKELKKTAGHNWSNGWSFVVRGWRGLREIAFKRAGSRNPVSQNYRDAMNGLLQTAQHSEYKDIPKDTRAAMTKLIGHIDEIDAWYATLSTWEKERWTNPQTIVKHCPPHLLVGSRHNVGRRGRSGPKKKKGNPEADTLRKLLIELVNKYVMPVDVEAAKGYLERLYQTDPDESLDDIEAFGDEEAEA
jgi:hypothetical protein